MKDLLTIRAYYSQKMAFCSACHVMQHLPVICLVLAFLVCMLLVTHLLVSNIVTHSTTLTPAESAYFNRIKQVLKAIYNNLISLICYIT